MAKTGMSGYKLPMCVIGKIFTPSHCRGTLLLNNEWPKLPRGNSQVRPKVSMAPRSLTSRQYLNHDSPKHSRGAMHTKTNSKNRFSSLGSSMPLPFPVAIYTPFHEPLNIISRNLSGLLDTGPPSCGIEGIALDCMKPLKRLLIIQVPPLSNLTPEGPHIIYEAALEGQKMTSSTTSRSFTLLKLFYIQSPFDFCFMSCCSQLNPSTLLSRRVQINILKIV